MSSLEVIGTDLFRVVLEYLPLVDSLSCLAAVRPIMIGKEVEDDDNWWRDLFRLHNFDPVVMMGLSTFGNSDMFLQITKKRSWCGCINPKPCMRCRKEDIAPYYVSAIGSTTDRPTIKNILIRMFFTYVHIQAFHEESDDDEPSEREVDLENTVEELEADLYQVCEERDDLEAQLEELQCRCDQLQAERDELEVERDELEAMQN